MVDIHADIFSKSNEMLKLLAGTVVCSSCYLLKQGCKLTHCTQLIFCIITRALIIHHTSVYLVTSSSCTTWIFNYKYSKMHMRGIEFNDADGCFSLYFIVYFQCVIMTVLLVDGVWQLTVSQIGKRTQTDSLRMGGKAWQRDESFDCA